MVQPLAPPPEVLTLEQAADLLRLHPRTVRTLAQAGALPGRKVGRQWRFPRQALVDWLATPIGHTGDRTS